jgi:hypothetical protein
MNGITGVCIYYNDEEKKMNNENVVFLLNEKM